MPLWVLDLCLDLDWLDGLETPVTAQPSERAPDPIPDDEIDLSYGHGRWLQ